MKKIINIFGGEMKLEIETARLIIRPPSIEEFDEYWEMNNDPEAKKYTGGVIKLSYDETLAIRKKVCDRFESSDSKVFSVIEKSTGMYIGYCGFKYCELLNGTEICYGYNRSAWGKGYGQEAAMATLPYAFETLKLKILVSAVNPKNIASERILRKIDMQYDGQIEWKEQGLVNKYSLTSDKYFNLAADAN
ncbi:GNAT family N-acetyltransferase [Sporosarcina sp. SG10008]|uniref:GNAT family N-acetyltransferase n=1 Tax=Sporosarcina sp. SG10008 TaxID=3373103 RepID=UPI0037DC7100